MDSPPDSQPCEAGLSFREEPALWQLRKGLRVFGRFCLEEELGRGGMAVVWKAQDERLGITVALKFLSERVAHNLSAARQGLRREITRGLTLTHPGIVRVYDFHEDPERRLDAIAMEFVNGATLAGGLGPPGSQCFDVAEPFLSWARALCEVLAFVHESARVVHRDLKPSNLMLSRDGVLKVSDFGIAATLTDAQATLTSVPIASGTPPYMSPEQFRGEQPTAADDIYSLGATFYHLLTSRPPFLETKAEAIRNRVETARPPSMADRRAELGIIGKARVPRRWEETIAACLAKAAADRPPSVRAVAERLGLRIPPPAVAASEESPAVARAWLAIRLQCFEVWQKGRAALASKTGRRALAAGALVAIVALVGAWWVKVESPRRVKLAQERQEAEAISSEQQRLADLAGAEQRRRDEAVAKAEQDKLALENRIAKKAADDAQAEAKARRLASTFERAQRDTAGGGQIAARQTGRAASASARRASLEYADSLLRAIDRIVTDPVGLDRLRPSVGEMEPRAKARELFNRGLSQDETEARDALAALEAHYRKLKESQVAALVKKAKAVWPTKSSSSSSSLDLLAKQKEALRCYELALGLAPGNIPLNDEYLKRKAEGVAFLLERGKAVLPKGRSTERPPTYEGAQKDQAKALDYYRQALQLDPENKETRGRIAALLKEQENARSAEIANHLEQANAWLANPMRAQAPSNQKPSNSKPYGKKQNGPAEAAPDPAAAGYNTARGHFAAALKLARGWAGPVAFIGLERVAGAEARLKSDRLADALKAAQNALEEARVELAAVKPPPNPSDRQRFTKGITLFTDAGKKFQRILELDAGNAQGQAGADEAAKGERLAKIKLYLALGRAAVTRCDYKMARDDYALVRDLEPEHPALAPDMVKLEAAEALHGKVMEEIAAMRIAVRERRWEEAHRHGDAAKALDSNCPTAKSADANLEEDEEDWKEACARVRARLPQVQPLLEAGRLADAREACRVLAGEQTLLPELQTTVDQVNEKIASSRALLELAAAKAAAAGRAPEARRLFADLLELDSAHEAAAKALSAPAPSTAKGSKKPAPAPDLADFTAPQPAPWTNSLGVAFVPVDTGVGEQAKNVFFAAWETRVQDYGAMKNEEVKLGEPAERDWRNPGFAQAPDHPVVLVSYLEATAFCRWLTRHERAEGRLTAKVEYRLPTNQEWQAANRLKPERPPESYPDHGYDSFPWSEDYEAWPPPAQSGNFPDASRRNQNLDGLENYDDGYPWTAPVNSLSRNIHNLYHMSGNAREWLTLGKGANQVSIGGYSFKTPDKPNPSRFDFRRKFITDTDPFFTADDLGFRVVLAPVKEKDAAE